jgi:hypothetical protein
VPADQLRPSDSPVGDLLQTVPYYSPARTMAVPAGNKDKQLQNFEHLLRQHATSYLAYPCLRPYPDAGLCWTRSLSALCRSRLLTLTYRAGVPCLPRPRA